MDEAGFKLSVIGLGYVGLPLAVAMSQVFDTIGFDIRAERIRLLREGIDRNDEVTPAELKACPLRFTDQLDDLLQANFHIVAVPTPIDSANRPDLGPILGATETVGRVLKPGDIVVYESTVYPGLTEEICLPLLEKISGLRGGVDFRVGYSPERINPGDREHSFTRITKVVSGQDAWSLERIAHVYGSVVTAGIHRASSIRVAEAAKIIENTQRDLNIALMNELSILFDKMGIDTQSVLAAAGTKWNFLRFQPGLVGGHCIGVDPYYLTHKAESLGYTPQIILAGRRINDHMGQFIATRTVKEMIAAGHPISRSRVTLLGLTFKENCPDLRNSKVMDVIRELREFGVEVQVHDALADPHEALEEYGIELVPWDRLLPAQAVIVAVAHRQYRELGPEQVLALLDQKPVLIDVKAIFDPAYMREKGIRFWRL